MGKVKTFVLVDIDGTLLFDINTLNRALIHALKENGLTEIYLFSNMDMRDIPDSLMTQEEGEGHSLSRAELVHQLAQEGVHVISVITQADPIYARGLGAAYEELYVPVAKRAFPKLYNANISSESLLTTNCQQDSQYKENLEVFLRLNGIALDENVSQGFEKGSKRRMFDYFIERMVAEKKIDDIKKDVIEIVFFDDKDFLLDDVGERVAKHHHKINFNFSFHPVQIKKTVSAEEISSHLSLVRKRVAESCNTLIKEAAALVCGAQTPFDLDFNSRELKTFDKLNNIVEKAKKMVAPPRHRFFTVKHKTAELSQDQRELFTCIACIDVGSVSCLKQMEDSLHAFVTARQNINEADCVSKR